MHLQTEINDSLALVSPSFATQAEDGCGVVTKKTTVRNRGQAEAVWSAQSLNAILNAIPDAIITVDPKGIIHSLNAGAETLFGYSAADACRRQRLFAWTTVNRIATTCYNTRPAALLKKAVGACVELIGSGGAIVELYADRD